MARLSWVWVGLMAGMAGGGCAKEDPATTDGTGALTGGTASATTTAPEATTAPTASAMLPAVSSTPAQQSSSIPPPSAPPATTSAPAASSSSAPTTPALPSASETSASSESSSDDSAASASESASADPTETGAGGAEGAGGGGSGSGGEVSVGGAEGETETAGPSGDFAPCPATGVCKILPLGDSITDGIGSAGGYRVHLFELAVEGGKDVTFLGGSMNGPDMVAGQSFPKNHEGHSGWTIQQIDDITPSPSLDGDPNIILLHIGTNDMYQTPSGADMRLGTLIDQIIEAQPEALLVVSNIIPFPSGSGPTATYNGTVPGVVQARIDAGKHLLFVDQFADFPESELGDGVHPNATGYARMAEKWYAAIESYLP